MEIVNGRPQLDTEEEILDALIADAKEHWGDDLNDNDLSIVRTFYRPIAARLAETQESIGLVLDASQIDYAEGQALDLLTALIGIRREPPEYATGKVKFSRSSDATTDYVVPEGTIVQTDSIDPIKFETTDSGTIPEGGRSVTLPVEAVEGGPEANLGANTLTVMPDPPVGVEDATNPNETNGGAARENDEELRKRAKNELAQGSRASAPALLNQVKLVDGVRSATIFVNDSSTDNTGSGGLPDHSFELVISGGDKQELAQAILDTKAAGDTSYSGVHGNAVSATADLPNGDTMNIDFSRPTETQIYVSADVTKADDFPGKDALRDSIVDYIGGIRTSGNETAGLGTGEDVLYGEVEYAIRDVDGVYDVQNLVVDTSSSGTNQSNISIADSEVAIADGTDSSLSFNVSSK